MIGRRAPAPWWPAADPAGPGGWALGSGGRAVQAGQGGTHVDEVVPVADEQVAQDAGLIEVPQADHVLHAVDRRGVHGLDVRGILWGDPVFLQGSTAANVRLLSWSQEMHTAGEGTRERRGPPVCEAPVRVLSCSVARCHQL